VDPGVAGIVTDVPMFDMPAAPCFRCGQPKDTPATLDVCSYCLHLDHRVAIPGNGCHWCAASTPRDAATKGGQAAADADPEFADAVTDALATVRRARETFTAADVRDVLEARGVTITRPAAMGSVFGTMHALGLIKPTGEFVPSPVKGQHGRPLRVWRAA
jgi:hypothetical protein